MNNKLANALAFIAGAGIGVAATWQFFKKKYKKIADEEIESVKQYFPRKEVTAPSTEEKPAINETEAEKQEHKELVEDLGYNHSEENKIPDSKICVIPPESVGEREDYEITSLTYYADDVLVDEFDEPVVDIEGTIGYDSLKRFGEYEDDAVHVRNEVLKTDFEILRDMRTYSEATSRTSRPENTDQCETE